MTEFTQREIKILNLLATGKTDKEIAKNLSVSEATIKASVRTLKRIMGAENRQHLVFIACKRDFIKGVRNAL